MSDHDDIRVSDGERERAAARVRGAAAEGRLGVDELEERLERALSARTRRELAPLTADLPEPRPRHHPGRRRHELRAYVAVMLLLVAIWALTGAGYFWPVWPMVGWGMAFVPGVKHGRRRRARA